MKIKEETIRIQIKLELGLAFGRERLSQQQCREKKVVIESLIAERKLLCDFWVRVCCQVVSYPYIFLGGSKVSQHVLCCGYLEASRIALLDFEQIETWSIEAVEL